MELLKQYIITVVAAALVSGLILCITGKKGTVGAVTKLLCGLFLSVAVISPLSGSSILNFSSYENFWQVEADRYVAAGVESASQNTRAIIKNNSEAYILDKAVLLGASIQVYIALSQEDPPVPYEITVTGQVSPYARNVLKKVIEDEIGIPEERQIWT